MQESLRVQERCFTLPTVSECKKFKPECIPVGYVPSASMVILEGRVFVSGSRGCLPLGWECLPLGLWERVSAYGCRGNVWVNTPWVVTSTPLHAGIHTLPALCMLEYTSPREQNHRQVSPLVSPLPLNVLTTQTALKD